MKLLKKCPKCGTTQIKLFMNTSLSVCEYGHKFKKCIIKIPKIGYCLVCKRPYKNIKTCKCYEPFEL